MEKKVSNWKNTKTSLKNLKKKNNWTLSWQLYPAFLAYLNWKYFAKSIETINIRVLLKLGIWREASELRRLAVSLPPVKRAEYRWYENLYKTAKKTEESLGI